VVGTSAAKRGVSREGGQDLSRREKRIDIPERIMNGRDNCQKYRKVGQEWQQERWGRKTAGPESLSQKELKTLIPQGGA